MLQDSKETMQALLMKPIEAARIAGVSPRTITRMCAAGQIKAVRLRGCWRIHRDSFMRRLGITED